MEVIHLSHPGKWDIDPKRSVMALGFFDGVHRGHEKVILTAKRFADENGLQSAVMTFYPHPAVVLGKKENPEYLTPLPEKVKRIEALGVDRLYVVKFDEHFSSFGPQQFVDAYLVNLSVVHAVAGFDFTYGHKGEGTMRTLPEHASGRFQVTVIPKVEENGEKVSSTKIRELLRSGDVDEVPPYLGRYYEIEGTVVNGEKRGRTIGFPTANIESQESYFIPATGIYAVRTKVGGHWHDGVASIGFKPTFHDDYGERPAVEVHLFDFDGDLYGKQAVVRWFKKLRDEEKFDTVDALVNQMNRDAAEAQAYLQTRKG
ncbi:MAG TPA: bifunctional riboflavin kinase/FAD synthetase [Bacillales bacterium]|nr:bifunctional riboflavin kinase/FAD synthetase [Bacillales bacterium]